MLTVSAKTGEGMPALREALAVVAREVPPRGVDATFRLPIDRVFTIRGFGTVVTGTVAAGQLSLDERVEIYPRAIQAKVRGIQTHGRSVSTAVAGQRAAVNLQGIERAADRAGRRAVAPGPSPADVHARRHVRAAARRADAAQDAPARALSHRDERGHGARAPPGRCGPRAGADRLRPAPAGGAGGRPAARSLRDPELFPRWSRSGAGSCSTWRPRNPGGARPSRRAFGHWRRARRPPSSRRTSSAWVGAAPASRSCGPGPRSARRRSGSS